MSIQKSPFKFLDPYIKEDREIYFGREREIDELYHRLFESRILIVYGESGTGKSSLVSCGLMSKFRDTDCLPLYIRRSDNILESISDAMQNVSETFLEHQLLTALLFKRALRALYIKSGKPIFFIFDQFEELFIFGTKEEKLSLVQIVKTLVESDIDCRLIFIIREEYFAGIAEFEKQIPNFLSNRMRVERMDRSNAVAAINGPCNVFEIRVEDGFAEGLLKKLNPDSPGIELTYLQIFLDKIFNLAVSGKEDDEDGQKPLSFTLGLIEKTGDVSDLLGSFLDEQISLFGNPETALGILKSFVSSKGTKRQLNLAEIRDYANSLGTNVKENVVLEVIGTLVHLRILCDKNEKGCYELRHDALAAKIFKKISAAEIEILEVRQFVENAFSIYEKRGKLLTVDDLKYLAPFEDKLYPGKSLEEFIIKSKNELLRARRRRRNIASATAIALILILSGFTIWALSEKQKSDQNYLKAKANNFNYLSKETAETDPTIALRLAEYALSIDSGNQDIVKNLNRIYSNNNFYKIVSRHEGLIYPEGIVNSVAFSPDGKTILTGSWDKTARLWDLQGNLLQVFKGHKDYINSVAFSPDGKSILTGSYDNTARLWDLQGNVLQLFLGHERYITSVAFSPDGKNILTSSYDKTARLWDLHGNVIAVFRGHEGNISSVAFSPDDKSILTGSWDNTARLWDLQGNVIQVFRGHEGVIFTVAFSPDGRNILTGSYDKTARLWDFHGNVLHVFREHEGAIFSVAFSHDGKSILTGSYDNTARLWDLQGTVITVFRGHEGNITSVAFSPDDKSIVTASYDKTARLWKLQGNVIQMFRGHEGEITSGAFSPDGKNILTGSEDKTARLWDLHGNVIQVFRGHERAINSVAFSPDGKNILTGSYNTACLWDLHGNVIEMFRGPEQSITSVAFSPDGKNILTGSYDNTARLWNLQGNVIEMFQGHEQMITSVAFSPDGKNILTGSYDNTARLWDLHGNVIEMFQGHEQSITSVAFSPDGKSILTGSYDKTARLWGLQGIVLQEFKGHDRITSVAFSPDGKNILTGSYDNTARLWDLHGNVIEMFQGHEGEINSVAFSPDGKCILTGSFNKTAQLWEIKETLKEFQRRNAYQELSIEQKLGYGIIEFNDVLKLDDEKTIYDGAEYYYGKINSERKDKKTEYMNNAEMLFHKGLTFDNLHGPIVQRLTDLCIQKHQFYEKDVNKEIDKYFKIMTESDDLNELINALAFYIDRTDSTTIPYGYPEKAISIAEKLLEMAPTDKNIRYQISFNCSNLSFQLLNFKQQYQNSLTAIKIALKDDSTYQNSYTKLPLVYLYNDMYSEAEVEYQKWKDKPYTEATQYKTFREGFLADIANLESRSITHPYFAKVKELLKK